MSIVSDSGDTIAALSSPPGEGAIAVIRISGPESRAILSRVFQSRAATSSPRRVVLGTVRDGDEVVDHVLATFYAGPASYTGEDMAEISGHGGVLVAARVLETILKAGARAAEPGEFTRRAFINGKLDLTQAEAVMDLIRARTPLALRSATEQLGGRLGGEILALRHQILETVAHLEAWIDFPEEGIDPAAGAALAEKIDAARAHVARLLSTADQGRILREGVRVAIVGKPNAGKSSLLNRLLGMDRAIVSAIPGTTRDTIEESACLGGILFRLTDTAGLRETDDPVEREGVERSRRALEAADLVLHLVDATDASHVTAVAAGEILVVNKIDLVPARANLPPEALRVSAVTGEGLDELVEAMITRTVGGHLQGGTSLAAINARHKALLASAAPALESAAALVRSGEPPELAAIELRAALEAIGRIVGSADTEEILGVIFSSFCIGK